MEEGGDLYNFINKGDCNECEFQFFAREFKLFAWLITLYNAIVTGLVFMLNLWTIKNDTTIRPRKIKIYIHIKILEFILSSSAPLQRFNLFNLNMYLIMMATEIVYQQKYEI